MLQVLQPSTNFDQTFQEPRYPARPAPPSPILREQLVRLIKNITKPVKKESPSNVVNQQNGRNSVLSQKSDNKSIRNSSPFPPKRNIQSGYSRGKENKNLIRNDKSKGILEKQNGTLPMGGIRRLPLRPKQQTTSISQTRASQEHQTKLNNSLNQSHSSSDSAKTKSCEIKGHAIPSSQGFVGTQKQRQEIHKKTQKLSASYAEFKRRLMMNQNKVHPSKEDTGEKYQIYPVKDTTPLPPQSPKTPRTYLSRKQSSNTSLPQTPSDVVRRETADPPRLRYRTFTGKEATKQIHPVETYVVVQNQRERIRGQFFEPVALTMHNLSMHDMFNEMDIKKKRGEAETTNSRILKWLNSVKNSVLRPHRIVRFNIETSGDSSSAECTSSEYSD